MNGPGPSSALPPGFDSTIEAMGPVAAVFTDAGHDLFLVGGIVRDRLLGIDDAVDVDCTTPARPDAVKALLGPLADAMWTQGERFGTIGARIGGLDVEITTYRAEYYDPVSRKPVVAFGDELRADLARRDFTINAMAVSLVDRVLHDPFGGADDLAARLLRTPLDPAVSFGDDPLRMLRAARFLPRFGLRADDALVESARRLADRLTIVSSERIHDELERLLDVSDPRAGFDFLVDTGLLAQVLGFEPTSEQRRATCFLGAAPETDTPVPQLDRRRLRRRRRIGFLSPFGVDGARGVLGRLKYSIEDRDETIGGVALIDRVAATAPGDVGVRELLSSTSGDATLLDDALAVIEAGAGLASIGGHDRLGAADHARALRSHWLALAEREDLADLGPPLDGAGVMAALDLEEGPLVGEALSHLRGLRIRLGPMTQSEALDAAGAWFADRSGPSPRPGDSRHPG